MDADAMGNDMTPADSKTAAHLKRALDDESLWLRLGAARALAAMLPSEPAQAILLGHWERIRVTYASAPRLREALVELITVASALEWSKMDGSALLVDALGEGLRPLLTLLQADWTELEKFLTERLPAELPELGVNAQGLLVVMRQSRVWRLQEEEGRLRESRDRPMTRYENAAWPIEHDSFSAPPDATVGVFSGIAAKLRSENPDERNAGVAELLCACLTERNWYRRSRLHEAASALGYEASLPLLSALRGDYPLTLTMDEIKALSEEGQQFEGFSPDARSPAQNELFGRELLSYIAGEALQQFRDADSAMAIVDLAVTGAEIASERARRVIFHLQLEVCAPALCWYCVNGSMRNVRDRAFRVLSEVLDGVGRGEHDLREIDDTKIDPRTSLEWLLRLVERCRFLPNWATDPACAGSLSWSRDADVSRSILRFALMLVPYVEGSSSVGISYYSSSLWDKFCFFMRGARKRNTDAGARRELWRRPLLEMPDRCLVGSPVKLTVRLETVQQAEHGGHESFAVPLATGASHTELLVVVKSLGFLTRPDYGVLRVSEEAVTEPLVFILVATQPGLQTVEVGFFPGSERIGFCSVDTTVKERTLINRVRDWRGIGNTSPVKVWEVIADEDLERRGSTRAVIFVDHVSDGSLSFSLLDPQLGSEPQPMGNSPLQFPASKVTTWTAEQGGLIRGFLKEECSTKDDLEGVLMGLRALGNVLYEQLVPPALTGTFDKFPEGATIAIESNAHWVPWEILSTSASGRSLGERLQLIRIPRKPALRVEADADVPAAPAESVDTTTEIRHVVSVTGDGVFSTSDSVSEFNRRTFGVAAGLVRNVVEGTLIDLHQAMIDADLVHFTCHGRSPPYHLSIGPGQGRRLFIRQVRTLDLKAGAVVFVNACGSAQSSEILADMENFGYEFYMRGARPFLGTMGPVPIDDARQFAGLFYSEFIGRGIPAGDALVKAKRAASNTMKRPTWMFYCLFGASTRRVAPTFAGKLRLN